MAQFGIEYKDGTQQAFDHPCFAWVGDVYQDYRMTEKKTVTLGDRAAYFFYCATGNGPDTKILFDSLVESPMVAEGVVYSYCDGTSKDGLAAWTWPHIRAEISVDIPGWKHFMLLKMSAKTASYSSDGGVTPRELIKAICDGATFAEAMVLAKVNGRMAYSYPYLYLNKDSSRHIEFLRDNKLPDWSEFATQSHLPNWEPNYNTGNAMPFKECERFCATAPDQPFTIRPYHFRGYDTPTGKDKIITARTVKELRKDYDYFPNILKGELSWA